MSPVATSFIKVVMGLFLFKRHAGLGQGTAHFLEVAETGADAGAAQLDG